MNNDVYGLDERAQVVAKDILVGSELVNHPNYTYVPSKQLRNLMSDEEIATTIMHLKRIGALDIDDRRMYLGGRIQAYPGYEVKTNPYTLKNIANPIDINKLMAEHNETISYNAKDKVLSVGFDQLKIRGDMLANLCETILNSSDKNRVWSNDEILESWGWSEDRIYDGLKLKSENRVKIYQKAKVINERVALLTKGKITDLLDFDTKSVSINKKYRENVS